MSKRRPLVHAVLERILARSGYGLRDLSVTPIGLPAYARRIRDWGFNPKTILDVGIGNGTNWLYESFPSAHFELFEALDLFEPVMVDICAKYDGTYHIGALGAQGGTATIEINPNVPTSSTLAGRLATSRHFPGTVQKTVEVRTLDSFGPFAGPVLLKLDVEGFESEVLRGARETLAKTEIIISEIGIAQRHANELSFGEFIQFVELLGFSLIDFAELAPLGSDKPLAYIDAVFVITSEKHRIPS